MPRIKFFIACLFIFFSSIVYSQSNNTVFMRWKLKPNEVISYKAYIKDVSPKGAKKLGFGEMFKGMGGDSTNKEGGAMQQMMDQMQSLSPEYYIASLAEKKKDLIDIELNAKKSQKKPVDSAQAGFALLMNAMESAPMLRGAVGEDGSIKSFYLRSDQKNILALFFQLPARPVKIGDEWQIDTQFINMDQSFKCDSSFHKNVVKVTGIENIGSDKVVTLAYDIVEYASGVFSFPFALPGMGDKKNNNAFSKILYKATARFSVEKGRWLSYEGEIQTTVTGIMESETTQYYALVP
jgi:hypothetical protein